MVERIVVVGSLNMDLVVEAPRRPRAGETLPGTAFHTLPGGKGANQAAAAGRLAGDVAMVGRVGDDAFGRQLQDSLSRAGVIVEHVTADPQASTGVALIVVEPDGQNSIIIVAGANGEVSGERLGRGPLAALLKGAKVCLLQLEIPLEAVQHAAQAAAAAGATVVLDPAPARTLPPELLRHVDILTPNAGELLQLTGTPAARQGSQGSPAVVDAAEKARELLSRGVGHVVVTLGADGAMLVSDTAAERFAGHVVDVVDTTAAGDAFAGALAVALAEGRPLPAAIPFANAAGALACTRLGAQPSLPARDDVLALLAAAGLDSDA